MKLERAGTSHVSKQGLSLTPLDVVLTMDFLLLATTAAIVCNELVLDGRFLRTSLGVAAVITLLFAGWRSQRAKVPAPPPSTDPLRRSLGVLLLGVGAAITLVGAVVAVITVGVCVTDDKVKVPFYAPVLGFLPLLLGHAVMFGGAKVRAQRAS